VKKPANRFAELFQLRGVSKVIIESVELGSDQRVTAAIGLSVGLFWASQHSFAQPIRIDLVGAAADAPNELEDVFDRSKYPTRRLSAASRAEHVAEEPHSASVWWVVPSNLRIIASAREPRRSDFRRHLLDHVLGKFLEVYIAASC